VGSALAAQNGSSEGVCVDNKGRPKESVHYRLALGNRGDSEARNVTFRLLTSDGVEAPFPQVMVEQPIKNLRGGTELDVRASVAMSPNHATEIEITWEDEDGQSHTVNQSISI
jgi:hypothetical protein